MKNSPPLYLEMLKFQKYLVLTVHNFSKPSKRNLGDSILNLGWHILDCIVESNARPNAEKYQYLFEASVAFDKLKMRVRFAYEMEEISHKKYAVIMVFFEDIGSMLNGWLKWAQGKRE